MVQLIAHILHIAATCTSLGGLFYSRMVLWPNLIYVTEESRQAYLDKMIKRFSYIKWVGVSVIVITGVLQWIEVYPQVTDKDTYLVAFGLKMLGAIALFTITFLLALPKERLKGMQKNRGFWSALNIISGLVILIGAAWMRQIRMGI